MQQDEEYDGQHDKNRRRRGRNTEAHSERTGKRKAREEQAPDLHKFTLCHVTEFRKQIDQPEEFLVTAQTFQCGELIEEL